jgi:MYXO-CTERM domain-containing protein
MVMCGVVGLLICGQSFGTELLIDPGMNLVGPNGQLGQTPNAPWVFAASRGANPAFDDGAASEAFADHDGGGFGLFFKAFVGNPPWDPTAGSVDAHIYQDVAGTPGTTYTLTGWWGAEDNYSGLHTPGANAIFALDFLTGGGGLIGSSELDLEAAGLGDPSLAGFNYEQFVIMAVAPAGTVTVRARGSMLDGVFFLDPGQALVTDQWSLTARSTPTPEPGTALMGGLAALALLGSARRRRRES